MMKYIFGPMVLLFLLTGCAPTQPPIVQIPYNETKEPAPDYESEQYIEEKVNPSPLSKTVFDTSKVAMDMAYRNALIKNALSYLNKRDGGDCSGFVNLINIKNGYPYYLEKELSESFDNARKSRAMFNLMNKKGLSFEGRDPRKGDLVFFENTERRKSKHKVKVAENITHVGIVTKIDQDGTVEFIHHSNGKNIVDYMNFNYPKITNKDGKKINTYMKRCPSKNGAPQPQCMNIAFFVAYGTF
ncbi:MAG: NlpC/P60 family protein [Sulfurospirillaceae bacterium]|nr:NlpC/P60 family protein [Sulfurospirillaceae bacterium]MDD2825785.1 NlpC/P60 family protein [Sulfurospirillaceae bacterium]